VRRSESIQFARGSKILIMRRESELAKERWREEGEERKQREREGERKREAPEDEL